MAMTEEQYAELAEAVEALSPEARQELTKALHKIMWRRRIIRILTVIGVIATVLSVGPKLLELRGLTAVNEANENAFKVGQTATLWRADQKSKGNDTTLYTVIVDGTQTYAPESLEAALSVRCPPEGSCAIVCDENGLLVYAFWSEGPLTEEDLAPTDAAEQRKIAGKLFGDEEIIGWHQGAAYGK